MSTHRLSTLLVHAGARHIEGAVVPPIFQSANFLQDGASSYGEVVYARLSNTPQHRALASKLAAIEDADDAMAFASGMAAVSTALLAVVRAGDHVLVQRNTYGGTATLIGTLLKGLGVEATEVDSTAPETWAAARTPKTRAFYVEAISNPLLEVPDLDAVVAFCREHRLTSLIDNTFASPTGFRPIPFGFDLSIHSATKFLNGHSDLVAGVVAGGRAAMDHVAHTAHHLGGSLDAHACFLLDRGMKTLTLRMARQTETALRLALLLAEHPAVSHVRYPGLAGDAQHERAKRYFDHFGSMIAFELASVEATDAFLRKVKLPLNAASLGGVESLVVQPARSSHLGMPVADRERLGITERLIRMSVGIEDGDDLVEDLLQALVP